MLSVLQKSGFSGTFDFFYLPIDFRNKCNLGEGFARPCVPQCCCGRGRCRAACRLPQPGRAGRSCMQALRLPQLPPVTRHSNGVSARLAAFVAGLVHALPTAAQPRHQLGLDEPVASLVPTTTHQPPPHPTHPTQPPGTASSTSPRLPRPLVCTGSTTPSAGRSTTAARCVRLGRCTRGCATAAVLVVSVVERRREGASAIPSAARNAASVHKSTCRRNLTAATGSRPHSSLAPTALPLRAPFSPSPRRCAR